MGVPRFPNCLLELDKSFTIPPSVEPWKFVFYHRVKFHGMLESMEGVVAGTRNGKLCCTIPGYWMPTIYLKLTYLIRPIPWAPLI
jgi:hypothetical protein